MMGAGFTLAMVVLGAAREISSAGTLFANASLLLGQHFQFLELTLIPDYKGFLLTALPPGGFILLGFMVAAKRLIERRTAQQPTAATLILQPPQAT
jgi:Na+-translocating ferredoxin:NAD+ oxidoreductase subunit E